MLCCFSFHSDTPVQAAGSKEDHPLPTGNREAYLNRSLPSTKVGHEFPYLILFDKFSSASQHKQNFNFPPKATSSIFRRMLTYQGYKQPSTAPV
jgi:hypothetical protein